MKHILRSMLLILILQGLSLCFAQGFNIQAFADTTKYEWQDYRERLSYRRDLDARQSRLQLYEMESVPVRGNIIKSAVIPGWGQFATNHNTKATVILSMELVSIVGAIYFYDQAQRNYDKYKAATQIDDINHLWGKTQTPQHYSLLLTGLAGVIWAYNIYDVVVSTTEYNADLWRDIMSRSSSSPLQISPTGIEFRF